VLPYVAIQAPPAWDVSAMCVLVDGTGSPSWQALASTVWISRITRVTGAQKIVVAFSSTAASVIVTSSSIVQ
jgi:hypothetical protein